MCTVLDERESACDWADVEIFKLPLSWTVRRMIRLWWWSVWDFELSDLKLRLWTSFCKILHVISSQKSSLLYFKSFWNTNCSFFLKKKKIWIRSPLTNYTIRKDTAGGITSTKYSAHTLNCNISGNYWLYDFSYQFWLEGLNFLLYMMEFSV